MCTKYCHYSFNVYIIFVCIFCFIAAQLLLPPQLMLQQQPPPPLVLSLSNLPCHAAAVDSLTVRYVVVPRWCHCRCCLQIHDTTTILRRKIPIIIPVSFVYLFSTLFVSAWCVVRLCSGCLPASRSPVCSVLSLCTKISPSVTCLNSCWQFSAISTNLFSDKCSKAKMRSYRNLSLVCRLFAIVSHSMATTLRMILLICEVGKKTMPDTWMKF